MIATRIFFWIIISLFLYQNCGKEKTANSENNTSTPFVQSSETGPVDLTRSVIFKIQDVEIELMITDGRIMETENPNWEGQCIRPDVLDDMSELLTDNQICIRENNQPPHTFCAQIYTFPYIELFVGDETARTKVGEKANACPEQTIHFCENDETIENMFRSLDIDRDFMDCPAS